MKKFILVISPFILMACSSQKSEQLPKDIKNLKNIKIYSLNSKIDTLQLKPVQSFGNDGNIPIGIIGPIAIDQTGNVYITAYKKQRIDIFKPNGTYLAHIAAKGRAPGEFIAIGSMKIAHHKLYVYDYLVLGKISAFSLNSLYLINEWSVEPLKGMKDGKPFYILNDSTFLIGLVDIKPLNTKRNIHFYTFTGGKFNQSGEVFKKRYKYIYSVKSGHHVLYGVRPWGRTTFVVKNGHYLYTAWSNHFLIKVYNLNGKYERAFYYPSKNMELNKHKVIEDFPKSERQMVRKNLTLPKTWPVLHSMKRDSQNRLWISTIVKNQKVYQWWILNKQGKLLARFSWPRDKPIQVIKNGYVYTIDKNKKGVQRVVKYKVEMKRRKK